MTAAKLLHLVIKWMVFLKKVLWSHMPYLLNVTRIYQLKTLKPLINAISNQVIIINSNWVQKWLKNWSKWDYETKQYSNLWKQNVNNKSKNHANKNVRMTLKQKITMTAWAAIPTPPSTVSPMAAWASEKMVLRTVFVIILHMSGKCKNECLGKSSAVPFASKCL